MRLSRRDALVALASTGLVSGSIESAVAHEESDGRGHQPERVGTLRALAEVLYPSEVDATEEFVETYVVGRSSNDEQYRDEMAEAVDVLEAEARDRYDGSFAGLSEAERDDLLRELGLHSVDSDPEGTPLERVRYYLINELLYALFTTPEGGRLIGLENPPGYPGGLQSYQRGTVE